MLQKSPFVLGKIPKDHRLANTNKGAKTSEKGHSKIFSYSISYFSNKNLKKTNKKKTNLKKKKITSLSFYSSSLLQATLLIWRPVAKSLPKQLLASSYLRTASPLLFVPHSHSESVEGDGGRERRKQQEEAIIMWGSYYIIYLGGGKKFRIDCNWFNSQKITTLKWCIMSYIIWIYIHIMTNDPERSPIFKAARYF